jgi:hypothetical protein
MNRRLTIASLGPYAGLYPCGGSNMSCVIGDCSTVTDVAGGRLVVNDVLQTFINDLSTTTSGEPTSTSSSSSDTTAPMATGCRLEAEDDGVSIGTAVGAGIGAGVGVVLLVGLGWFLFRRTKKPSPLPVEKGTDAPMQGQSMSTSGVFSPQDSSYSQTPIKYTHRETPRSELPGYN